MPRVSGQPRILAIVPALNESATIATVVAGLRDLDLDPDVLVIDDGSVDGTARAAAAAGARVTRLPFNLGIGGAVQAGYIYAQRHGYEIAVQVDGDGQHLPAEVARLVDVVARGDADLVIGSRFLDDGGYRPPFARRLGIRIFGRVLSTATQTRLSDTTSGFRAASPRAIGLFARHYPADYPEVESILIASRAGLRVREVPVRMSPRLGGRSSITPLRSGYYVIKVLLALSMQLLRRPESAEVHA
jgi:glycosyltransferase involved in cell wall biosynthesis